MHLAESRNIQMYKHVCEKLFLLAKGWQYSVGMSSTL